MPKASTACALVDSATKCRDTAAGARSAASSQALAELALARVSSVVKVFEATMNSVVSGSRCVSVPARCAGSRLETKCTRTLSTA